MKTRIFSIWIFALFFTLWFHVGYSSEKKVFTVGVQDFIEYLPYSEYKEEQYRGFNRELLDLFAGKRGYIFEYHAYPIKRLDREFLQGRLELKYPDNPYWIADLKKGKNIKYSNPVVEYIDGVLVLPENKGRGINHLRVLGIIAGFTPFAYLDFIKAGAIKISENHSYEGLLRQTVKKRVDSAYSNIAVSRYYLEHILKDRDALVFDPDLPHTRSNRYLSSIKYPQLIDEFNDFLKKHRNTIKKLKESYRVEEGIKWFKQNGVMP